jgi:uncharacterized phiE125 gp8 family phage protein
MGLRLITAPEELPVSLAELQREIPGYVASTDEDAILTQRLNSATKWFQKRTYRQLVSATYLQTFHDFSRGLRLELRDVVSVTHVKYYDSAGILQTVSAADYFVDVNAGRSEPDLVFKESFALPLVEVGRPSAVQVTYVAGYGTPADVPEDIKLAIMQIARFWYWQRDAAATANSVEPGDEDAPTYRDIPFGVWSIIHEYNASGYT